MTTQSKNYALPFAIMSFLLFLLGFVTWINNILVPFLKDQYHITNSQSQLVSAAFFGAYILSIFVGGFVKKSGYKMSVIYGSLMIGIACLLFIPSVTAGYTFVLISLFLVAIGVVVLQVAANPYVIALGSPETSSSRLTLAMAVNSAAASLAPFAGSFILGARNHNFEHDAMLVKIPFIVLGIVSLLTALLIYFQKLPEIQETESTDSTAGSRSAWDYPHLILGFIAIGIYMGIEVGVGNFFIKYVSGKMGVDESKAASFLVFYPLGYFVGRLIGAAVLKKVASSRLLFFNSLVSALLVAISLTTTGILSMVTLVATGLFHSIMWSVIFDLGLKDVNPRAAKLVSGILCTGVVFTGMWMWLMGNTVDLLGNNYASAYYFLFFFYAFIAYYAVKGSQIRKKVIVSL